MLRHGKRVETHRPQRANFFFIWGGGVFTFEHAPPYVCMYVTYLPFRIAGSSRLDFSLGFRYLSSTPRNFRVHLEGMLCNHIYISLLEKRIGLTPTPFMSVLEIMPTCRRMEAPVSLFKREGVRTNKTRHILHLVFYSYVLVADK